ncbi:MAG: HAD family hydrolase [Anaerolineae bacterium]|nr:HAD family hydrolase [Anaerolineae bacterium]
MINLPVSGTVTAAMLTDLSWVQVFNPGAILGNIKHALFDFDGTLSVIRRGWENIMLPMMVEMICGRMCEPSHDVVQAVAAYIERSTGILTIHQMEWLVEAVHDYGFTGHMKSAREYKKLYNERLLQPVRQRISQIGGNQLDQDKLMLKGARSFLQLLHDRDVKLYLASGTDHTYVLEETAVLGIQHFFEPHIYGALDDTNAYSKERIIRRIIKDNILQGEELAVIGDGPVEIRNAKTHGALALGVAADEDKRCGFETRKVQRLKDAGADLVISGFEHYNMMVAFLCGSQP